MDENYLKFIKRATKDDIADLVRKLNEQEDPDLEEIILFLNSFLI